MLMSPGEENPYRPPAGSEHLNRPQSIERQREDNLVDVLSIIPIVFVNWLVFPHMFIYAFQVGFTLCEMFVGRYLDPAGRLSSNLAMLAGFATFFLAMMPLVLLCRYATRMLLQRLPSFRKSQQALNVNPTTLMPSVQLFIDPSANKLVDTATA